MIHFCYHSEKISLSKGGATITIQTHNTEKSLELSLVHALVS